MPGFSAALCRLLETVRQLADLADTLDTLLLPLTYLAQETGFYDQAHFIRDFREVCGITPSGYRDNRSDFYNEPLKF